MQHSEGLSKLATALSAAQGEMPVAEKDTVNGFLKNKYADLGAVISAARPVLAKHGLAIVQFPITDGERVGVETILTHSSGEWMSNSFTAPAERGKLSVAQEMGAIFSYFRRYAFSSVCAMYSDEDKDGNKATDEKKNDKQKELRYCA